MGKIKVVLAGKYPKYTYDNLRKLLTYENFDLVEVNTQEAYDTMTCAEIMILRSFKAPKEIIERNKNLKMILRWGAGNIAEMKDGAIIINTARVGLIAGSALVADWPTKAGSYRVRIR